MNFNDVIPEAHSASVTLNRIFKQWMVHREPHVNIWLQNNLERSKPHVNVTQVIKVTCLQKISLCHWGLFLAFLVSEWSIYQLVIIKLQAVLLWVLFFAKTFSVKHENRGWSWAYFYAILSWPTSVGCCCILHYGFLHFLLLLLTSASFL